MIPFATPSQWFLGLALILSSFGVISLKKPVHAALSFLLSLLCLAALYLELSAEFIAVMQVLVYAGAILVLFMFVIILFQDAHEQIAESKAQSSPILIGFAFLVLTGGLLFFAAKLFAHQVYPHPLPDAFGTVEALGRSIYLDFVFPFEVVVMLFLTAIVGALYTGKKEK